MLRAAGTGISAIIDAQGRIVRQLGLGKGGVIDGLVPVAVSTPPPFARYGNGTVLILALALVILVLAGQAAAGRRRAEGA